MTNKPKKTSKTRAMAKSGDRRSFGCNDAEHVAHALDLVLRDSHSQTNPIEEQLRQCPEAFKAGELLERALNSLKYGHDEESQADRWLPPAGAVLPPIV
jgi:hypothetical protein